MSPRTGHAEVGGEFVATWHRRRLDVAAGDHRRHARHRHRGNRPSLSPRRRATRCRGSETPPRRRTWALRQARRRPQQHDNRARPAFARSVAFMVPRRRAAGTGREQSERHQGEEKPIYNSDPMNDPPLLPTPGRERRQQLQPAPGGRTPRNHHLFQRAARARIANRNILFENRRSESVQRDQRLRRVVRPARP